MRVWYLISGMFDMLCYRSAGRELPLSAYFNRATCATYTDRNTVVGR